ncbi:MAG: F0F1 ATP synthase subunit delta [Patescibacteria group bacterium]
MKIKPEIYAQALIESKKTGKKVAESFWKLLQKNKQYRDLDKILKQLDVEYAKANNTTIAEVISAKELSEDELKEIEQCLICHFDSLPSAPDCHFDSSPKAQAEKSYTKCHPEPVEGSLKKDLSAPSHTARDDKGKKFIIHNSVEDGITGIIVKANGQIFDLSLESKISKLKQSLK